MNILEENTMFENLVEVLKANPRKIVYTEGTDARILESAARLKQGGFLTPILVGNVEDVTSRGWRSSIPPTMTRWTRWPSACSTCARAK